jgi:hypothetical protein
MNKNVTENVVYRYTPDNRPEIRYRSTPSLCTGTADTLAEARARYRADLSGLLQVGRRDLPPVIEHVETVVHGMWVREKVGAVHRDHGADRMFLQTLLAHGQAQEELRAYLDGACGVGVEPVIVLTEREDTVGSILDQMTPRDAVVIAYSDPDRDVGWAAIYGPEAEAAVDVPRVSTDAQLYRLPVATLADRYARMRVETLPYAS